MKKITFVLLAILAITMTAACKEVNLEGDRRDIVPTTTSTTFNTKLAPANQTNDTPAPTDDSYADTSITDVAFLMTLDTLGIDYYNEADGLAMGHKVCADMRSMEDPYNGFTAIGTQLIVENDWTIDQAGGMMGAAIHGYCPQFSYVFE